MSNGAVIADRLRKIASIIETHNMLVPVAPELMIPEENQLGAALLLIYVRDLFTVAKKEVFTRDEILVILNMIQNDRGLFSADMVGLIDSELDEECING